MSLPSPSSSVIPRAMPSAICKKKISKFLMIASLQQITQFTLEQADHTERDPSQSRHQRRTVKKIVIPDRFTALLFDDVHANFGNLPQLQAAGLRFVSNALSRAERLGIFTTSGKVTVDFTDDRAKLQNALRRLAA